MTKVTVHQPTFLPYLGFFRKVAQADIFVVYDSAQYSRGDWHNRNRVLSPTGPLWLTVPVSAGLEDSFQDALVADKTYAEKHLSTIRHAYQKAPYFDAVYPSLKKLYHTPSKTLAEHNWKFMEYFFDSLGLSPKILWSHDIPGIETVRGTDALILMVRHVGGDTYISGADGPHYMDMEHWADTGISVELNDFIAQPYPQLHSKDFVPFLSVIDALMHVGPEGTRKLIGL